MKLKKWTVLTPICAYVYCDTEIEEQNTGNMVKDIQLSALQTSRSFDNYPDMYEFLKKIQEEDLLKFADEEVQKICKKILFGHNYRLQDGYMHHECVVYTPVDYEELPSCVYEFIIGQLSDGWGESLSQKSPAYSEEVVSKKLYFDSDACTLQEYEEFATFEIFLNFWDEDAVSYKDIKVECEEENVDWLNESPKIFSSRIDMTESAGYKVTTVYKFEEVEQIILALKQSCIVQNEELVQFIVDGNPFGRKVELYVVIVNEGLTSYAKNILGVVDTEKDESILYTIDSEKSEVYAEKYGAFEENFYQKLKSE